MKQVVRWTFWNDEKYSETEWAISDTEEQEYINAVVRELQLKEYKITGFAHQRRRFCTPVFNDGKRYACSFRQ